MDNLAGILIHGGDAQSFIAKYGKEPLDFSANVNPLGVPDAVKQAICSAAADADRYPDPLCRELRTEIAKHEGINPDQVFCAAGAADVIYRLAAAIKPKQALIPVPTFAEYDLALSRQGCIVNHHMLKAEDDFELTEAFLPLLRQNIDIAFLCTPNNPTGKMVHPKLLKAILERCERNNIWLVVDECFLGFTDYPEQNSMVTLLPQSNRLVILKAFTKLYGMAGVRLGYCLCADMALLQQLYEAGPPWHVSVLAQQAGVAALGAQDYVRQSRTLIANERMRVSAELTQLGFDVVRGEANYLLFFSTLPEFNERLCKKGVLIRDCSNYIGLSAGWFRIGVRTVEENNRLLSAVKEILEGTS